QCESTVMVGQSRDSNHTEDIFCDNRDPKNPFTILLKKSTIAIVNLRTFLLPNYFGNTSSAFEGGNLLQPNTFQIEECTFCHTMMVLNFL
ncbi:3491_t:CDS:1, partial [Gigaspora rosea]